MALNILKTRSFEKDGLSYTVKRVSDPEGDPSYLTDTTRYDGVGPVELRKLIREGKQRKLALDRGEWEFIGVIVEIRKQTATNWADGGPIVGQASIWGVESDSDEKYLTHLESDTAVEAEAEVERLREALGITSSGVE